MQYLVPRKNGKKNSDKVTCQNFDRSDEHTCIFIHEEINICWDTLSYTCLIAMTCNDMHLLLGQASFTRVSMLCPINRKKLAPSSCSGVTKTIWKDISTTPFMRNQLKQSMSKHLPPTKESKSSKATTNHGEPKTKRQDSVKCSSL